MCKREALYWADVPQDKRIVLGLISTKKNALEPAEGIIAQIAADVAHRMW